MMQRSADNEKLFLIFFRNCVLEKDFRALLKSFIDVLRALPPHCGTASWNIFGTCSSYIALAEVSDRNSTKPIFGKIEKMKFFCIINNKNAMRIIF